MRRRRAVGGRSADRSVEEVEGGAGLGFVGVVDVGAVVVVVLVAPC